MTSPRAKFRVVSSCSAALCLFALEGAAFAQATPPTSSAAPSAPAIAPAAGGQVALPAAPPAPAAQTAQPASDTRAEALRAYQAALESRKLAATVPLSTQRLQ